MTPDETPRSLAELRIRERLANNGRNPANNNAGIRVGSDLHHCEMLLAEIDSLRAALAAASAHTGERMARASTIDEAIEIRMDEARKASAPEPMAGAGWKLVPVEPTMVMCEAGNQALEDATDSDYDSDSDGNRHSYTTVRSTAPAEIFVAMLAASPPPPDGWRGIESAPDNSDYKTTDPVDLWAINRANGNGFRVVNCRLAHSNKCWLNERGSWFTGKRYYDPVDRKDTYDPSCTDGKSVVVTHWRPLPSPPGEK